MSTPFEAMAERMYGNPDRPAPAARVTPAPAANQTPMEAIAARLYPDLKVVQPAKPVEVTPEPKPAATVDDELTDWDAKLKALVDRGGADEESSTDEAPAVPPKLADVPDEVLKQRDTMERRMFSPSVEFRGVFGEVEQTNAHIPGLADLTPLAIKEGHEMLADCGFTRPEAETFVSLARRASINPPTYEQREAGLVSVQQELVDRYGLHGANQKLADAQALIQRDPRLVRAVEVMKLGDHPDMIRLAIDLGQRARAAGKFQRTPK